LLQKFAREIEAAHLGVLVEVAQDVGQLQRAAEMVGEILAHGGRHAEDLHRQAPDRAGHAVAIQVELLLARRPDVLPAVHLHAVDDGEKVDPGQLETADGLEQAGGRGSGPAGVDRLDGVAPARQAGHALRPRAGAEPRPAKPPRPVQAMIVEDAKVALLAQRVELAAARQMPILVLGETGTGKEQMARHAHAASGRSGRFVPVNCAALTESLAEAELFGYADGAFTGARRGGAAGFAQEADGGTLFLDEIGDMPVVLQAVLLRFLDDWMVRPVGGAPAKVDVLLVSATNMTLDKAIAEGRFRSDLLYRLNTVEIALPRLAERADFAAIARRLLAAIDPACAITDGALRRLARRRWPGNIRELRNVLTRYTLQAPGHTIDEAMVGEAADLPCEMRPGPPLVAAGPMAGTLQESGDARVRATWEAVGGNISETARRLGISRNTVYRALGKAARRG
ncbi:MAG: sigma 54-interacting transcriptional regulator, partial [Caulobacteraceae bacterium]|nr:sigma 54-interacting transcriptional regulator [Caulobacter sp.]